MFTQMRFLLQTHRALVNDTFHQRETMPDRLAMTVNGVLEHSTIKSAQCMGLDRQIGSLTPGKQADLILLRKSDINMRAAVDPVSSIVLHAGVSNVDTVMVRGKTRGSNMASFCIATWGVDCRNSITFVSAALRGVLDPHASAA